MRFKVEKMKGGVLMVTITIDAKKPPIVIEGEQLDGVLQLIEAAKKAEVFRLELDV